jgi:hypothetical protein
MASKLPSISASSFPAEVLGMKLLRIVAMVVGVLFVGSAHGQSNSPQPASNQTQVAETQSQGKTPAPDSQISLSANDSKSDSHRRLHVRLGTIGVGAGYTRFSGPFFYNPFLFGYYPYGFGYSPFFYDPFFYSPFFAPGYYGGFSYSNGKGEVKLSGAAKTAEVYLNGGYAGVAGKLKSMWLEPGAYDLSVGTFRQRIYVLSGKSLKIPVKN